MVAWRAPAFLLVSAPSLYAGVRCHLRAAQLIAFAILSAMGWIAESGSAERASPSPWHVETTWAVTVYALDHQVVGSMKIRVTAEQAISCMAGNWRRLEIVKRQFKDSDFLATKPLSYSIEGRELTLGVTEVCDGYVFLHGTLSDAGATGDYGTFGLEGFKKLGTFVAVVAKD